MAKGKVKHSVDETQLNLFGDLLDCGAAAVPRARCFHACANRAPVKTGALLFCASSTRRA